MQFWIALPERFPVQPQDALPRARSFAAGTHAGAQAKYGGPKLARCSWQAYKYTNELAAAGYRIPHTNHPTLASKHQMIMKHFAELPFVQAKGHQ